MFSIGFVKSLIFQLFVSQNIMVKYLNPSFLVKIPTGGYCLVTTFPKVGYFSIKPQPSLMPDHQTLQLVPDSISPQSMYPDRQEALHTGLQKTVLRGVFNKSLCPNLLSTVSWYHLAAVRNMSKSVILLFDFTSHNVPVCEDEAY